MVKVYLAIRFSFLLCFSQKSKRKHQWLFLRVFETNGKKLYLKQKPELILLLVTMNEGLILDERNIIYALIKNICSILVDEMAV